MALSLQIQTEQAQANIEAATSAIRDFITVTQQLGRTTQSIDAFSTSLASIRPVSPEVAASLRQVADAAAGLGAASAQVQRFQAALGSLGGSGITTAAASLREVSTAAAGIKAPAGLEQIAAGMTNAGRAAASVVSPMAAAMSAANQTSQSFDRVAQGMSAAGNASRTTSAALSPMVQGMSAAGQAAEATRGGMQGMSAATNEASQAAQGAGAQFNVFGGILRALAFTTVVNGLKDVVQGSLETSASITRLKIQIDNSVGTAGAGAQAFAHLSDEAFKLGIPLEGLTASFGRFVNAMLSGGHTLQESEKVYDNFMTVFRALGLSAGETQRSFLAVDQIFQKGKVSSEELVRQLGQNIPAMDELAKSMGLVDGAGKPMITTLQNMMRAGQVSSDVMLKFSDDLRNKYLPALQASMTSGAASIDRLGTAWTLLKGKIGDNIFQQITPAVNSLAQSINTLGGPIDHLGQVFGTIVGTVGAGMIYFVQNLAIGLGNLATIVEGAIQGFQLAYQNIMSFAQGTSIAAQAVNGVITVFSYFMQVFGPMAATIVTVGVALTSLSVALRVGAVAANLLLSPFTRIGLIAAAAAAAIVVFGSAAAAVFQTLLRGGTFVENFTNNFRTVQYAAELGAQALFGLIPAAEGAALGLGDVATSSGEAGQQIGGAAQKSQTFEQSMGVLYQQSNNAAAGLNKAATGAGHLASTSGQAAGSSAQLQRYLNSSASSAEQAAQSYERAASAARDLAAAQAQIGGGGGGGQLGGGSFETKDGFETADGSNWMPPSSSTADNYSPGKSWDYVYPNGNGTLIDTRTGEAASGTYHYYYGGIAGEPGVGGKRSVSPSVFAGAPHFAEGGISDAGSTGIPAILHPGEAVVPLQGGAIPVSISAVGGDTGSNNNSGAGANPVITLLTQITQNDIERDQLISNTNDKLDLILGQLTAAFPKMDTFYSNALSAWDNIVTVLNLVNSGIGKGSGGGGSSGGSFSGGGSFTGSNGQPTDAQSAFKQLQSQIGQNDAGYNYAFEDSFRNLQNVAGKVSISGLGPLANFDYLNQQYQQSDTAKQNNQVSLKNQALIDAYIQQYGQDAYNKASKGGGKSIGPLGFATGSPNASQDSSGGFLATLHPDEAVIPLPDGRSVPVKIPDVENIVNTVKEWKANTANYSQPASSGGNTVTHNNTVQMIIQTPDANSFRKSQPQIIADLRGQLQRAQQTSGSVKRSTEDPTKRNDTPKRSA